MNLILVDLPEARAKLLPFTYIRPIAEIRIGILKISEKWSGYFQDASTSFHTASYLQAKFPGGKANDHTLWINSNVLPDRELSATIRELKAGEALFFNQLFIAARGSQPPDTVQLRKKHYQSELSLIDYPWDIFRLNSEEIKKDYLLLTLGRTSEPITDPYTRVYGEDIFVEKGASVKAAILNAENGPIYIGKDTEVQEGAIIRGSFALCEGSTVAMGARIRGDSTIGPHSKVGGEVANSVMFGYSNKGHDGYLGNSVLGEWCNLGADTNTSNMKNNYQKVKMWDFASGSYKSTGLQFCGLIMGDHSKCGINTMFNTGTTVGVSTSIFGGGFPPKFIPSYTWGGVEGSSTYQLEKAFETAGLSMKRRNKELTEADKVILTHIFEQTARDRVWEKK